MQEIISLGYNFEVSFQIEKYVRKLDSSLFSWVYVCNDESFLRALENIDDVFTGQIHFHLPSDDMFYDEKYDLTFHGRTHKSVMFDSEGNLINQAAYDECLDELRSRVNHLKEKLKNSFASNEEKIFVRKLRIKSAQDSEKTVAFIQKLNEILSTKVTGGSYKLYIVVEKAYFSPELRTLESDQIRIRALEHFAPDSDTKDGADHEGWKAIFDEFVEYDPFEIQSQNTQLPSQHDEQNTQGIRLKSRIKAVLKKIIITLHLSRYVGLLRKVVRSLRQNGFRVTLAKIKNKLRFAKTFKHLRKRVSYTKAELEAQRKEVFPRNIKISILVPLYNTPEKFLREMIQSVLDQTYSNWELCLADGSDESFTDVGCISREYAQSDARIRYKKLQKNMGISGNTNACIDMSTGDYIALFDHDDLLHPAALHDVVKEICKKNADFVYTDEVSFRDTIEDCFNPHFKPDYAPDTLRSYNYICHLSVFSRTLLERAGGGFRSEFDGSQDYDLILRLTEQAECIAHIPQILYYWRSHANSVAQDISAKPYTLNASKKALEQHLERVGLKGKVKDSSIPSTYQIAYEIEGTPLVSILIPNKDNVSDLKKCLESLKKSTYQNWEAIVIENNSTEQSTFAYYAQLENNRQIRVVKWAEEFNFSAINNFGAKYVNGQYILLLNNDVEIINSDWLEQMLMFAQREDVGAVGAMLYYPDNTVQHGGVILGIGDVAGHAHKYFQRGAGGYMSRMTIAQNYSCVTGACLLMRRKVWDDVHGLDEEFAVAFNDIDLCMRIRQAGYLIVWTPYAELYHHESKSRGAENTPEKWKRYQREVQRFHERWAKELATGDPYYNPNFTLDREDFSLR